MELPTASPIELLEIELRKDLVSLILIGRHKGESRRHESHEEAGKRQCNDASPDRMMISLRSSLTTG
jgi:hypothetical protein